MAEKLVETDAHLDKKPAMRARLATAWAIVLWRYGMRLVSDVTSRMMNF